MKEYEIDEVMYAKMYKANQDFRYLEKKVLIPNGFIKLLDDKSEYIAFQPDFNIVFYLSDVYFYSYESYCFIQPFKNNNQHDIRVNKRFENCIHDKVPFPVFERTNYLNITNLCNGFDNYGYEASLRRIANYPLLMEAIGEENRNIIHNLINTNESSNVKTLIKK